MVSLMRKIFASVKTTGTLAWKHGIFEYAFLLTDENNNIIDVSFSKMNPGVDVEYDSKALELSGVTKETISMFTPHEYVYRSILEFLDKHKLPNEKFMLIGYNASFCFDFLNNLFKRNAEIVDNRVKNVFQDYFYYPGLDVMQMANLMLLSIRQNIPDFKFETICSAFEIPSAMTRDARSDVKQLYCLFNKLTTES